MKKQSLLCLHCCGLCQARLRKKKKGCLHRFVLSKGFE